MSYQLRVNKESGVIKTSPDPSLGDGTKDDPNSSLLGAGAVIGADIILGTDLAKQIQIFDETSLTSRDYTAVHDFNSSVSTDVVKLKHPSVSSSVHVSSDRRLKILIYVSYCLMTTCEGAFEPLGGSLYVQFEHQLNTQPHNIAYILSVKPVCSAFAALVTAAMLDYVHNSHLYICVISIIGAATLASMPYIDSLPLMFGAFGVVGYFIGAVFVSYPVYIFRLYPNDQNRALFFCMCVYGVSKTLMPLLIDVSLHYFDSYGPALWVVSTLLIILAISMACLPTPKHDPLRSAKKMIGHGSMDYRSTMDIGQLNENVSAHPKAKGYSYVLIGLIVLMMFTFSSFQSGAVNFIQKFLTKHLNENESIARYLISTYYAGQLVYRIGIIIFFKEVDPIASMCIGSIVSLVVGLAFVGFGNVSFIKATYIWLLYIIYICIGIAGSAVFPGVFKWGELIKTVGGLLSGIFVVAFAFGDAIMVIFVSYLVDTFGAYIIPYPIGGYILANFCFTYIGAVVYWRYGILKRQIIYAM